VAHASITTMRTSRLWNQRSKLSAGKPRALKHFPILIGRGELEHVLGKINGNGSLHVGLLPI
jgi:hypothetical protein